MRNDELLPTSFQNANCYLRELYRTVSTSTTVFIVIDGLDGVIKLNQTKAIEFPGGVQTGTFYILADNQRRFGIGLIGWAPPVKNQAHPFLCRWHPCLSINQITHPRTKGIYTGRNKLIPVRLETEVNFDTLTNCRCRAWAYCQPRVYWQLQFFSIVIALIPKFRNAFPPDLPILFFLFISRWAMPLTFSSLSIPTGVRIIRKVTLSSAFRF